MRARPGSSAPSAARGVLAIAFSLFTTAISSSQALAQSQFTPQDAEDVIVSAMQTLLQRRSGPIFVTDMVKSRAANLVVPDSFRLGERVARRLGVTGQLRDTVISCSTDGAGIRNCRITAPLITYAILSQITEVTAVVSVSYDEPTGGLTYVMRLKKAANVWTFEKMENIFHATFERRSLD